MTLKLDIIKSKNHTKCYKNVFTDSQLNSIRKYFISLIKLIIYRVIQPLNRDFIRFSRSVVVLVKNR